MPNLITLLPPRIRAHILMDDCWIWLRHCDMKGYGRIRWNRKYPQVHRLVYELLKGPVPPGKQLHHTCKNKRCCSPFHLLLVTPREHLELEPRSHLAERTHCKHGHLFDESNTRFRTVGRVKIRYCRACGRENMQRYRKKVHS